MFVLLGELLIPSPIALKELQPGRMSSPTQAAANPGIRKGQHLDQHSEYLSISKRNLPPPSHRITFCVVVGLVPSSSSGCLSSADYMIYSACHDTLWHLRDWWGVIEGCVPVSSPGSMGRRHAVIGGGATSTVAETLTPSSSMRSRSGSGSSSSRSRSGSKSSDSLDVDIEIDVHDLAATKPHPIAGSAPSPTAYTYGSGSYGSHGSFGSTHGYTPYGTYGSGAGGGGYGYPFSYGSARRLEMGMKREGDEMSIGFSVKEDEDGDEVGAEDKQDGRWDGMDMDMDMD